MNLQSTLMGLGALLLTAGAAQAGVVEDFESGNPDNWQIDFNGTVNGFPISAIPGTVVGGGNPGNALQFLNLAEQIGPWFFNSVTSPEFSGDLRAKGVDGISCDMNFTTNQSSPFGSVFVAMIGSDMGTPEVTDDILCWYYDFAYAYNGFGPGQLPSGTWNTCTWTLDTSSPTLPAGWTLNTITNSFAGDVDAAWNTLVQNVSYVAFANGAPWGGFNLDNVDIMFDNITLTTGEIGTAFCFCDGSGSAAPCGNLGAAGNGCANGANSNGCRLFAVGSPSASASTVVLTAEGAVPGTSGLFFQANSQPSGGNGILFGDGLRCAVGGVVRLQIVPSDSNGMASTTVDLGATAIGGGSTHTYQYWYRDPVTSPCGAQSNTSNGLEIVWQP